MCIFCKIINKEIPSSIVYEDDDLLAILDLAQTTLGHTLVMPKKHYANILEIPDDELAHLMSIVKMLAKKISDKLGAKGFNLLVNTNEVAGQTVMHLHVHIIPRYDENDTIKIEFTENKLDLNEIANKINEL